MNQHVYLDLLKNKLVPWINATFGESGNILQHDGATSHTANRVWEWCKRNMTGFWPKELWNPSSPDLSSMDFAVWSILESKACSSNHPNLGALKNRLKACWDEISEETVRASCSQVPDRLRRVVKAKGGYIENLVFTVFLRFLIVFLVKYFHLLLHIY